MTPSNLTLFLISPLSYVWHDVCVWECVGDSLRFPDKHVLFRPYRVLILGTIGRHAHYCSLLTSRRCCCCCMPHHPHTHISCAIITSPLSVNTDSLNSNVCLLRHDTSFAWKLLLFSNFLRFTISRPSSIIIWI